jgi:hypothetical protein
VNTLMMLRGIRGTLNAATPRRKNPAALTPQGFASIG